MTGQLKEVFGIYANDRRQQGAGKIVVEVMTKADHAALCEMIKPDIERIAQAAGAAMTKNACIVARRGVRRQQETGLKQINEMLQEIKGTESEAQAIKWGLFAAGYANGMYCGDLMSKSELNDVIQVIDQTFTKTGLRIKTARRPFWKRIWKGAKA